MGIFEELGRIIGGAFASIAAAIDRRREEEATRILGLPQSAEAKDLIASVLSITARAEKSTITEKPETPKAAYETLMKAAKAEEAELEVQVDKVVRQEMYSMGLIDVSTSQYLNLPSWRVLAERTLAVYNAWFTYGVEPYLRRYWLAKLLPTIPPLTDILRFTVREVYDPERRKELLSVPTPKEAYEYGELWGLDPRYVDDYWAAHWELPPVGDLNEMLFRNKIDKDIYRRYIIYHDYDPAMIDRYMEIIYRLIPRVDLRRAWEANIPGFEDLTPHYIKLGYSPEDAEAEARLQMRVALAAEISDLERETELSYSHGYSTIDQAGVELDALGFHPTRVKSRIQYYEARAEREHKDALVDIYEDAFVKDLIRTLEELEERLQPLIARREVLDRILERAYVRKFKKPKEAAK